MTAIILRPMTETPDFVSNSGRDVFVYRMHNGIRVKAYCRTPREWRSFEPSLWIGWEYDNTEPQPVVTVERLEELLASERTGLQNFGVMDVLRQLIYEAKERANV